MPYKYVLTPQILQEKTTNDYVAELKKNKFSYPNQNGWLTLLRDLLSPDLLLQHGRLDKESIERLKRKEQSYDQAREQQKKQNKSKDEALQETPEAILRGIESDFKAIFKAQDQNPEQVKQVEALLQHYSQNPGYLTANALSSGFFSYTQDFMIKPDENDFAVKDVYMENDKIYLKVVQDRFLVNEVDEISRDQRRLCHLPGPVESLFELDSEKGFILKHLTTDSRLLTELYLGRYENTAKVLKTFQEGQNGIEETVRAEQARLSQIIQGKAKKTSYAEAVYKKIHVDALVDVFAEYREGKVSLDQLFLQVKDLVLLMKEGDKNIGASLVLGLQELASLMGADLGKNKIKGIAFDINSEKNLICNVCNAAEVFARNFLLLNPVSFLSSKANLDRANTLLGTTVQLREAFKDKNAYTDAEKQEAFLEFITNLIEVANSSGVFSKNLNKLGIMDAVFEGMGRIIYNKADIADQIKPTANIHLDLMRDAWQLAETEKLDEGPSL